ncbi:MAG: glycosyltransferase [Crocinitomicaceae bacterium]|nr:glycosyltransferase [Crocinitomicaceae bacterium]
MKTKKLILFTSAYPYGSGETFLETEISYLSAAFDQVLIVSNDVNSEISRAVPKNCDVIRRSDFIGRKDKFKAVFLSYNPKIKAEKRIIQEKYSLRLTKGIRNTMLISLYRGTMVRRFCEGIMTKDEKIEYTFYSYWSNDNAIGLALLKERFPEVRAITRTHGWDLYFEVTQHGYQPFRHLLGANLNMIYPISNRGVKYCKENWQLNGKNIELSRLGVSKQTLSVKKTGLFTLVSCSNVIPLKRVELILNSLKLIEKKVRWVHFGAGKGLEALMLEAKNLPSNIEVQFMGHVQNSSVLEWYQNNYTSLFVNVSTTEGIPVSIMEAMSFSIPVIATNVGGTSEIVNSSNGKLLPANLSATDLANEFLDFLSKREEDRSLLRDGAYTTWKENYDSDSNYIQFAKRLSF